MENINFDDNINDVGDDVDDEAVSENDGFVDDAEEPDDIDDDDFMLQGYDDLGLPNHQEESESCETEDLLEPSSTGNNRKRVRTSSPRIDNAFPIDSAKGFVLDDDGDRLPTKSSRVLGTFGRRDRRKGECLPAYHKRVSACLDIDDQLLMDMRDHGYTDVAIANRLAQNGGTRYNSKSISTRIMRIRLAQTANVDFLLAEGYKEWENIGQTLDAGLCPR